MAPRVLLFVTAGICASLLAIPAAAGTPLPSPPVPLPWDTMADAYVIPALPFAHSYSTVGYAGDYSTCCPYCYGPQPDVFYRYDPVEEVTVEISLCNPGTDYDTAMYLLKNGPGDLVACNDDACFSPDYPYQYVSLIQSVRLEPGNTYYIVVSGYSGCSGNYGLTVTPRDTHHFVRADGTGEFATIQDAINIALYGDVIELADGIYTGPGNGSLDYGGRGGFTLKSQGGDPASCIIDSENAGRGMRFSYWQTSNTVIEGVTLRGGSVPGESGGGILCQNASPLFRNCLIENCRALRGAGVAAENGDPTFVNCRFRQNWAFEVGGAAHLLDLSHPEAQDCTFDGNKAPLNGGAFYLSASSIALTRCTVVDNRATGSSATGGAIYAEANSSVQLAHALIAFNQAAHTGGLYATGVLAYCSDLYGNSNGDWGGSPSQIGTNGNISLDPLFCDFAAENYGLQEGSPCGPGTPPNPECSLIGAWPVSCAPAGAVPEVTGIPLLLRPNPTTGACSLTLPATLAGPVEIRIFDPAGRSVRVLGPADRQGPLVRWDGKDAAGRPVPSGTYLARVESARGSEALRVIVVR